MGTIVLKMTAEQISTLQKDLASYATATKNPYASFSAKVDGISVIAYTSGKVTFQGAKPEVLASRFGYQAESKHSPILEEKIPHKALLLSPRKYNEVVGDGKSHNAVSVKVALHNQAIFLLLQTGAKPDKIVIDAFTSEKNYQKYLKNERNRLHPSFRCWR